MSFFEELKRRNVIRVATAYVVLGWVLAQVAEFAFETFGAPDWMLKSLVIVLLLGLPLALFFAWAFELTPEGIKRESDVDQSRSAATRKGRKLDRAIIAVLLVALAWFGWDRFSAGPDHQSAPTTTVKIADTGSSDNKRSTAAAAKSVAVLPFVAMSSGPDDGYFADGLTEEILNSLARLPELLVTARTSAFSFKGKDLPVQDIAAVLNVQHIVEGSVRRSGDRLRVTAQLIRAGDGFHLWSETYDRETGDTFRIQTDIAEKIALALDVVLDDERRSRMAFANVRNPEAFVAYQKGMELFVLAHASLPQLPTLKQANVYFDQAIQLEPDFYSAYVARGDYFSHILTNLEMDGSQVAQPDQVSMDEARQALVENFEAAIRSAPDPARRLNTEFDRAFILGNWRGLASLIDAVLSRNDDCMAPGWLHLATAAFGRAEEALLDYENLVACDPLGQGLPGNWVGAAMWAGQFDRIIEIAGSYNDSGQRRDIGAYIDALAAAGRIEEAQAVIDTEIRDAKQARVFHANIVALRGDPAEVSRMLAARPAPVDINFFGRLIIAARSGNREAANQTAKSIDSRPFGYVPLLQAIYFCNCGAPFDLEATPMLAGMLKSSGLPWPPEKVVDWPLKHW